MDHKRLFLDIHAIQTLPPSNINRDDTGSPKTAQYGGVTRARVSSQAWKKAMRDNFLKESKRTYDVVKLVAYQIRKIDPSISEEEAISYSKNIYDLLEIKLTGKKKEGDPYDKAKVLQFISKKQVKNLAKKAIELSGKKLKGKEKTDAKKDIVEEFNKDPGIDLALFGRMVAENTDLNIDASAQVAHAISTHAVQTEFDYFTAVDDVKEEEGIQGAGMIESKEFNSSTLYRYANVALHELANQLGSEQQAINGARRFIEAFIKSMPTGNIHSFANQTIPEVLLITVREDRPVSLATAFENPVKSHGNGYAKESIERLVEEYNQVKRFVQDPLLTLYVTKDGKELNVDGVRENTDSELINNLVDQLLQESR